MTGFTIGYLLGTLMVPLFFMLIIGGIYYLLTRPRHTFLGAVFTWWNILIGAAILVLSLLGRVINSR